ncbi:filamentous hemagglutinin family outer membrane protein [Thalassoporum mexicanum PCC 7367]|uniref:CHAT domain-containing protein n=1 Tax=Thalassoporum mexicanum TaxID=3457544 RepID=UPI00029FB8B3|nr:CHAT domain-containing protein [Pseudanabaena sp. PCC 7367]AFY68447.1 filamentous hemagglutinin family outer membrane protein [Pseudanabaena sp. PCC 7367]
MRDRPGLILLLSLSMVAASHAPVHAQINPDGSTNTGVINGNTIVPTNGGTVSGGNLFHSFDQFNVPNSGVTFDAANLNGANINNIINRVTGADPSAILGAIRSSANFPRANVYLLNPNGIAFGNGASLDISGSFYAATGSAIEFGNGDLLSTSAQDLGFSASNPIGIQFAIEQPAGIINRGNLSVRPGKNISLVGGTVVSTGALLVPNGSVDVAAVPGNSSVVLRSPNFIVGLEVSAGAIGEQWQGTIAELPELARLLTGDTSDINAAEQLAIAPDGSLQLLPASAETGLNTFLLPTGELETRGSFKVEPGDATIKTLIAGEAQVNATGNLALLAASVQTTRSLLAVATGNLIVRDTIATPTSIQAGGNLTLWGEQGIDLLALNHPQNPIQSDQALVLRSSGRILADAFLEANVGVFPFSRDGVENLFSALEFTITPGGRLVFVAPENRTTTIQENIQNHRDLTVVSDRTVDLINNPEQTPGDATNKDPIVNDPVEETIDPITSDPGVIETDDSPSGAPKINSDDPGANPDNANSDSPNNQADRPSPRAGQTTLPVASLAAQTSLNSLGRISGLNYGSHANNPLSNVADLLLQEGRILEAQQTLDLSLIAELEDYLDTDIEAKQIPAQVLAKLTPSQRSLYAKYQQMQMGLVEVAKQVETLQKIPEPNLTGVQKQRLATLSQEQQQRAADLEAFIDRPEVSNLAQEISTASYQNLQANLGSLQQNAVLLYPLIRDDRVELILITPEGDPIRRTTFVDRETFLAEVQAFRIALETVYDPAVDAKVHGQKLYEWLIAPLEADLTAANAESLLYAPYAQLRYIPLSALHDGDRWLIERFRVNNITAANLQDFSRQPQAKQKVLAGAVTKAASFKMGDRYFNFAGLPFAKREIETLASIIPNNTQLLDRDFNPTTIGKHMQDHSLIHLATHAVFTSGKPEDSFILFGDGKYSTLADIRKWKMPNVDLIVLSACETAVGMILGNGEEILGFGYLMQQAGARATMASLWSVDDGGTQTLMDIFYTMLKRPGITKAEAMRQAQITLITGDFAALGAEGAAIEKEMRDRLPVTVIEDLKRPYYWAPFIMIGNGL